MERILTFFVAFFKGGKAIFQAHFFQIFMASLKSAREYFEIFYLVIVWVSRGES